MGYRENVTLFLFVLLYYLSLINCMPQCLSYNSSKYPLNTLKSSVLKSAQLSDLKRPKKYKNVKTHKIDKKRPVINIFAENKKLQQIYNFPENEYPLVSTPRTPYYLLESDYEKGNSFNKFPSCKLTKFSNDLKKAVKLKKKFDKLNAYSNNNHLNQNSTNPIDITLLETVADPFLETDYPLSTSEIRTPIYWRTLLSKTNENQHNELLFLPLNITSTKESLNQSNRKKLGKKQSNKCISLNKTQVKSKKDEIAFTAYNVSKTDKVKDKDSVQTTTPVVYISTVKDNEEPAHITKPTSTVLTTINPEECSDKDHAILSTSSPENQNILLDYFIDISSSTMSDYHTSSYEFTISPLTTSDSQCVSESHSTTSADAVTEFPLVTSTDITTTCRLPSNESNRTLTSSTIEIRNGASSTSVEYFRNNSYFTNTVLDLPEELTNGNSEFIYYSSSTLSSLSDFEDFGAVTAPEF